MTVSFKKTLSDLMNVVPKSERKIHLIIWVGGLIYFSWPDFEFRIGVFFSGDYSSILPNTYGTFLNILLFYFTAVFTSQLFRKSPKIWASKSFLLFISISGIEFLLDSFYFYIFYQSLSLNIVIDILLGSFLLNGIFFLIPGMVYGILKKENLNDHYNRPVKIIIEEGGQKHILHSEEILFVKSEGNYVIYEIRDRKNIMVRESLKSVEEKLPSKFIRCHRSYIINSEHVEKKTYESVFISDKEIPLGRSYLKSLSL